jgi:hypothetical protein
MPDGYQWPTDKIDVQMYAPGEQFVDRSWSACDTVLDYLRYPHILHSRLYVLRMEKIVFSSSLPTRMRKKAAFGFYEAQNASNFGHGNAKRFDFSRLL